MNEFDSSMPRESMADTQPVGDTAAPPDAALPEPVDPVRSAAGRLGGQRVHRLADLGREYEREHGLTPGRQRRKQLIQLGRRYEAEHGLRPAQPRRAKRGDAWQEFLDALVRVVKPAYRPAVERLVVVRPESAEAA